MTKPADLKKPAARGRSGPLKSAERAAIEATLKDAAAPLTRDEVAQRTGIAARKVLITLGNLVHLAKVAHRLPPSAGHPLTRWAWGARPEAGEKADEVPAGQYQGRELRAFSARPGAMDAFALPSMRNGQREPHRAPVLMGVANPERRRT